MASLSEEEREWWKSQGYPELLDSSNAAQRREAADDIVQLVAKQYNQNLAREVVPPNVQRQNLVDWKMLRFIKLVNVTVSKHRVDIDKRLEALVDERIQQPQPGDQRQSRELLRRELLKRYQIKCEQEVDVPWFRRGTTEFRRVTVFTRTQPNLAVNLRNDVNDVNAITVWSVKTRRGSENRRVFDSALRAAGYSALDRTQQIQIASDHALVVVANAIWANMSNVVKEAWPWDGRDGRPFLRAHSYTVQQGDARVRTVGPTEDPGDDSSSESDETIRRGRLRPRPNVVLDDSDSEEDVMLVDPDSQEDAVYQHRRRIAARIMASLDQSCGIQMEAFSAMIF